MFDEGKHWIKTFEEAVRKVILLDGTNKLFAWIENDEIFFKDSYEGGEKDVVLICNFSPNYVTSVCDLRGQGAKNADRVDWKKSLEVSGELHEQHFHPEHH